MLCIAKDLLKSTKKQKKKRQNSENKRGRKVPNTPEDLAGREGDVQKEDDARLPLAGHLLLAVAEDLRQQHQVVVVHPHHAVAVIPIAAPDEKEDLGR